MTFSIPSDNESGFTIIEAMICILLISVGLLAISKMQLNSLNVNQDSIRVISANLEATATADLLMAMDFNDSLLADGNTETTTLDSPPGMTIEYTVTHVPTFNATQYYKSILVTATWADEHGAHTISRTITKLP